MEGYIKLHRKILDSYAMRSHEYLALFTYLLLKAQYRERVNAYGQKIMPGQVDTGRRRIAKDLRLNASKIQRMLKTLEIEHMIEQQCFSKNRIITIVNWHLYQESEPVIEPQVNHRRTHVERRKERKNNNIVSEVMRYLNSQLGTSYSENSKSAVRLVNGRVSDNYKLEDFKAVIDLKVSQWKSDPKMKKYLRPSTLFNATKFEEYNQELKQNIGSDDKLLDILGGECENTTKQR